MTRAAVLLRGVNVGSHNRIAMADFRGLLEGLGCTEVTTYLQSGNAVVTCDDTGLAARVEQALRDQLSLAVAVLTRSAVELDAVVDGNPFDADPKLLHAVFLSEQVDSALLQPESLLPDRVSPGKGVLYVRYASSSQNSRASKMLNSRGFPAVATARNWRTVLALQELCEG